MGSQVVYNVKVNRIEGLQHKFMFGPSPWQFKAIVMIHSFVLAHLFKMGLI